ncbi:hypothetical protein F5884DRAFT_10527 [Xylogone sp. PMI_703]|nr:hypothetical protein F5884DRAFT_10527 [Xylogone sp. PMI_703]
MAEVIGLGASILGIATFGAQVVTKLRTFTRSYSTANEKVDELSSSVALTTSILTDLGNTVGEYEVEFRLKAENFAVAKSVCTLCFLRLKEGLHKAKKNDGERKGQVVNNISDDSMSPWRKLMFALGGEKDLLDLVASVERAKSNLQLLLDSVNLLVLKKLNKKQLLTKDQSEDLKILVQHIPALVVALKGADMVNWILKGPQHAPTLDKAYREYDNPTPMKVLLEEAAVPSDYITMNTVPIHPPDSSMFTKPDYFTSGDITIDRSIPEQNISALGDTFMTAANKNPEASITMDIRTTPTSQKYAPTSTQEFSGSGSPGKFESSPNQKPIALLRKEGAEKGLPEVEDIPQQSSSLPDTEDMPTFYEGWIIQSRRLPVIPKIYVFCGLKLRVYESYSNDLECTVKPFQGHQEELLRHVREFKKGYTELENRSRISLLLNDLGEDIQFEIKDLIAERDRAASSPWRWKVDALVNTSKPRGTRRLWKRKETTMGDEDWLIVLKGYMHDSSDDASIFALPERYHNPFASVAGDHRPHSVRQVSMVSVSGAPLANTISTRLWPAPPAIVPSYIKRKRPTTTLHRATMHSGPLGPPPNTEPQMVARESRSSVGRMIEIASSDEYHPRDEIRRDEVKPKSESVWEAERLWMSFWLHSQRTQTQPVVLSPVIDHAACKSYDIAIDPESAYHPQVDIWAFLECHLVLKRKAFVWTKV